jgi:hypothetical protein
MLPVFQKTQMAKGNKRLRLVALGLMLLGLWEMLALLQGVSAGMESNYRQRLAQGFGETHRTLHVLKADSPLGPAAKAADRNLSPVCRDEKCDGAQKPIQTAMLDGPVDYGADDATSAIGPRRESDAAPSNLAATTGGGLPQGSSASGAPFIGSPGSGPFGFGGPVLGGPGFAGPNQPGSANCTTSQESNPSAADASQAGCNSNAPGGSSGTQLASNTPPSDLSLSSASDTVGGNPDPGAPASANSNPPPDSDDGKKSDFDAPLSSDLPDGTGGPNDPKGSDGPGGGSGEGPDGSGLAPNQPVQLPEPITLSLFGAGLAGVVLLRRRTSHSSK